MPSNPRSPDEFTFSLAQARPLSLRPFNTRIFPVFFSVKKIVLLRGTRAMSIGKFKPILYVCTFALGGKADADGANEMSDEATTSASTAALALTEIPSHADESE